ncbi:MAG: B12-binding domain-containing radical SAM protein [Deltaproteobacteria bacterium]|nr:B12-binding domain-containing radical SAM protein [Deltaproteobacteria bacterium]MBZ0220260.1 B12-binding domain-containing radical SAM protein [Deltaproteobacteria bacterium]
MKIILVDPPFEEELSVGGSKSIQKVLNVIPALGLAYVAASAEKAGYEVKIFDCTLGMSHAELAEALKRERPDVVGITGTTPSSISMYRVARDVRSLLPDALVVAGGAHLTAVPGEVMKSAPFDAGVVGEGEVTFVELVRHFEEHGRKNLGDVQGIVFKEGDRVISTGRRPFIKDLDNLPFPARHLLPPLSAYRPTPASYRKLPLGVMITSRGCPFQCTFCDRSVFGTTYRVRSAKNVMDEVEELIGRYGAREIRFFDDTLTMNKKRVFEICDEFDRRKIRIPWTCLTRVSAVTPEMLKRMKQAGCWQVLYGLESGDDRMLKLLSKGITVEHSENATRWAREAGLSVRADFIVGTPGETLESMEKTLEFAKRLRVDYAHFNKFVPFPGTELYEALTAKGYKFDFTKSSSILDHSALLYVPEGMDAEAYGKYLDHMYRSFYLRPSYILRRLFSIKSLAQLKGQINGFFAIFGLK